MPMEGGGGVPRQAHLENRNRPQGQSGSPSPPERVGGDRTPDRAGTQRPTETEGSAPRLDPERGRGSAQ